MRWTGTREECCEELPGGGAVGGIGLELPGRGGDSGT